MIEYEELLKDIKKLDEKNTHLRKRFLCFKRNLMKSKNFFQNLKLQNFA